MKPYKPEKMKKTTIQFIVISLLVFGLTGAYLYNTAKVEIGAEISPEQTLKAPKEKILQSKEVDWIEQKEDKTFENKGKIVVYDYISDKKVDKNIVWDDDPYSSVERIGVSEKGNPVDKFYSGDHFYKDGKDIYLIEHGVTTTLEIFEEQVSWLDKLLGKDAFADTDTFYSGAGDGTLYHQDNSWANVHDDPVGTNAFPVITERKAASCQTWAGVDYIERGAFPFNTGATITAGATIVSSTLALYIPTSNFYNLDDDGDDFVNVIQTSQADETTLTTSDYNEFGATSTPTEGATRIDQGDMTVDTYNHWVLNATGRGWVKASGDTSNCGTNTGWTCLGTREGHDILDHAIQVNANYIPVRFSEYADITYDPYLLVEWTAAAPAVEEVDSTQIIIWLDD